MCDYSLMGIRNRLAKEGENLVVYSFPTLTKGLASPADLTAPKTAMSAAGILGRLENHFPATEGSFRTGGLHSPWCSTRVAGYSFGYPAFAKGKCS